MIEKFFNFYKSAAAFLQTGTAPPNTPPNLRQQMENANHLASKKFFITFTALFAIAIFYFSSVGILFFLPHIPEIITGFVTIFCKVLEIISIVIATYVGAQAAVDLRYNSDSMSSIQGISQDINENITEDVRRLGRQKTTYFEEEDDDVQPPIQ